MTAPAWAIGIDVGGTKIAGGLVRFPEGTVADREVLTTRAHRGPDAVLIDVADLAERLRRRAGAAARAVVGLGLGVPQLVDLQGRVTSGHTIDWRAAPLAERLAAGGPMHIEADVRAVALAEAQFGAGRGLRIFAFVTVGTGISSTLVQDGKPFAGARGTPWCSPAAPGRQPATNAAPWPGSSWKTSSGPGAGPPLSGTATRLGRPHPRCPGRRGGWRPGGRRRCPHGRGMLGGVVAFLINILDPEAVSVGGSLGLAAGLYWHAFVEAVRQHVWADSSRGLPLLRAALAADAGVIGAAAGAWHDAARASGRVV